MLALYSCRDGHKDTMQNDSQLPFATKIPTKMRVSRCMLCCKLILTLMWTKSKHILCRQTSIDDDVVEFMAAKVHCTWGHQQGAQVSYIQIITATQGVHSLSVYTICTCVNSVSVTMGAASIGLGLTVWCCFHDNRAPKVTTMKKAAPMAM